MSYVTMTHPEHGTTQVYVVSEVEANKLNGWVVQEEKELAVQVEVETQELSLKERYFEKFGKAPHHRMIDETIELALKD